MARSSFCLGGLASSMLCVLFLLMASTSPSQARMLMASLQRRLQSSAVTYIPPSQPVLCGSSQGIQVQIQSLASGTNVYGEWHPF